MLQALAKILADPSAVLLGTGEHALVMHKERADGTPLSPAEALQHRRDEVSGKAVRNGRSGANSGPVADHQLTEDEQKVVDELKARDREVRTHEQKHMAVAGELVTSGPHYTYQIGPDGKPYAVGGEVRIDTSPVAGDPEATAQKARRIAAAALAPGDPSGADMAAAGDAAAMEGEAMQQARDPEKNQSANSLYDDAKRDGQAADRYELKLWA